MKCPDGNTKGLNFNLYLSSLEGDKSQDEIDFEFLGNNKGVVQTNHYTGGSGSKEQIHELGFDCSDGFHDYEIKWSKDYIEWSVDGKVIRRDENEDGAEFPEKAMFLYASVWDASGINEGEWTGIYEGDDAPYACMYKDVRVPLLTAVVEASEDRLNYLSVCLLH
ncbi:xyloglucan endotransglucosylase/hydrolase protein 4-like [Papaver somniferum]|uniref:xyloglucan endotransglucosylase/hydrolase protein 4-like n=1 Tax=Papaver somniferum TaxID=3469 RepID=UPI000E6FD464|nr:xyloglucan endotransglucosylase/hydrolase protein 4-like [Papaver somniferum]